MSTSQLLRLESLAVVTARFRIRNERLARGLQIGFMNLETERTTESRLALAKVTDGSKSE
jgi:hypothetical protein